MTPDELQARTKKFALRVMTLVDALPRTLVARRIGGQLLDAGTSVGANYRAARRARSRREFIAKICIVAEEADESEFWLDLIMAGRIMPVGRVEPLFREAQELMKIFAATRETSKYGKIARSPDRQIAKSPNRQIAK